MLITGAAGNDSLIGTNVADTLEGGAGNDTLDGGFGNDSVSGGDGNDLFQLDYGNDTLRGGAGADVFVINSATGNDLLVDFDPQVDRINTSGWATLGQVTFRLDTSGNTVLSVLGLTSVTLQGVGQAQWGNIREPDGRSLRTGTLPDDYAATTATTGRVTVGGSGTTGTIESSGDNDWFAVDVTAGSTYTFTLSGVDGGGGTLSDPLLELRSATGTLLLLDDDGGVGLDSQLTYTAASTGRIYLAASGFSTETGTYRLSATTAASPPAATDDYAATTATTGVVTPGAAGTTGRIETQGDHDWFAVDVTAGSTYTFTLSGVDGGGGTLADPFLELRSNTGTLLLSDDDGGVGLDSQLVYTAASTGRIYLAASALSTGTGTYRLTASAPVVDDFTASTGTTGAVTVGGAGTTGNIERGSDSDWFAVDVTAGNNYTFTLSGVSGGGGTLLDPTLQLRSSTGTLLLSDNDSGTGLDSQITYAATATGRLYLAASGALSTDTGTYRLTAALGPSDDFAATTATTGRITVGGTPVTGGIQVAGDVDWVAVDVTAGTHYRFSLSGIDGNGGTLSDPSLALRTADGALITSDDDGGAGLDSLLNYTATSTGRLYLAVYSSSFDPTGTGTWRLTATTLNTVDDFAGDLSTTGRLAVGASTTGNLEDLNDSDWFAVDLVAGTRYVVTLSGADGGGGTLADPLLELRNSLGNLINFDDDGGVGADSELTFQATATGRYYIGATSYNQTDLGTYRISLQSLATDDFAGNTTTTGRLAVGGSATGRLETAGDRDWFAIDLQAGRTYTFALSGVDGGAGSLTDPWLRLLDANGVQLAFDDDNGPGFDSLLTFTATTTGRFYLSAEGASDTETGSYRLSATVEEPLTPDPAGALGGTPTDPLFAQQWHLNGTFGINVVPVWADYTGAGVRVGVLDQGIDSRQRDLDDNLLLSRSTNAATGAPGGTPVTSDDNHGTAVAGVIAAERNGFGGVGVAYNADLVAYYDPLDSSTTTFAATTAATFIRAINNVDVLNNSWGFGNFFKSTPNRAFIDDFGTNPFNVSGAALARLAAEGRNGLGTVVVQSAGNTGDFGDDTNLHNFQNSRFVITVAATDINGALASFSTPGASVLVSAPGVNITTTDRPGAAGFSVNDSTTLSGTSFSAPAVSGVAALILEANPNLGYRDVQEILALSARQVSPSASSWISNGAGTWNGGALHYSEEFGFGLVDARAAVRLAETWRGQQTRANEASLTASASPSLAIPDNNSTGVTSTVALTGSLTIDRVELDLNISHNWIGDLHITLTSPDGTRFDIVDRPGQGRLTSLGSSQDNVNFTFDVAGLLGEQAAGTWTLQVSDLDAGISGTLNSWTLRAYGNAGTVDDNYVFTDEFSSLVAATPARATIANTDGGYDILNAAAVTGAVSLNLGAGTGTIAGNAINFTANSFERAVGGDAADILRASDNGAALLGGRGADTLTGGNGTDLLTGGDGDDRLIGGAGIDIALFNGTRSDFTLTRDGDGFLVTGSDGRDSLSGVEVVAFNRGAIFLNGPGASLFNEAAYLAANPDVAAAVHAGLFASGQAHYQAAGQAEGRAVGGFSLFNESYYLTRYPDVAAAVASGAFSSGYSHYQSYGAAEGRSPSLYFDPTYYLAKNPDVAAAVGSGQTTAYDHYLSYGLGEGREASPYFSAAAYLQLNPDVAAAGVNAVTHFLSYGYGEGRLAGLDWAYFG